MSTDEKTVEQIIRDALETNSAQEIYNAALKYVDIEALLAAQPVNSADLGASFAVAGFIVGIKTVLGNLEVISMEGENEA